jgi:hypothetical protein
MPHRLLLFTALAALASACADTPSADPVVVILDAAADEDLADPPDLAPDPDQGVAADVPADMIAADMPAPDMSAGVNPCDPELTDAQRLEAWRAERIPPDVYDRATLGAGSRTTTTPNYVIYYEEKFLRVTQRAGGAELLSCVISTNRGSCTLICDTPMGRLLNDDLTSDLPAIAGQDCYLSGVGVEPPHLSFAVSHQVYASWVWTFDMDTARLLQSMRSIGPVLIKYFEHYGQCLRLWHAGDGDEPAFKLYDIRQGLWLPRLSADISEEDFFEEAASRVAVQ